METEVKSYLALKWGTLKSWNFKNSDKAKELLKEYKLLGFSFSAMAQNDTPRQKEIICELIDLCEEDSIYLDWDGEYVSRSKAKEYILNYKKG